MTDKIKLTEEQTKKILQALIKDKEHPSQVEDFFENHYPTLETESKKLLISKLEKGFVGEIEGIRNEPMAFMIVKGMLEAVSSASSEMLGFLSEGLEGAKSETALVLSLVNEKKKFKEDLHPILEDYAKKLSKLTDEEYADPLKHLSIYVEMVDPAKVPAPVNKNVKKKVTKNPFKGKGL